MKKKSKLIFAILAGVLISFTASILAAYLFINYLLSPIDPSDTTLQIFVVNKGESVTSIANHLQEAGLIKNIQAFKFIVVRDDLQNKIQAGDFRLSKSMSLSQLATELTHGTLDIWVTTLEGWRSEEVAEAIESKLAEQGIEFNTQQFIALAKPLEGYLFPDTYLIPRQVSPEGVIDILTNNFNKKVDQSLRAQIEAQDRSLEEVVTMASIVEREARGKDRALVAGILWKRIDNDWSLDADATLQFLKGYDPIQKTYWATPLARDKEIVSPYNTYKNAGLPPGPICNPSLSSIQAAANPTSSDSWFYLTDLQGNMHYSTTLEEHSSNVQKYLR